MLKLATAAFAIVALTGCSSLTAADLAGSYAATTFTVTDGGTTEDLLAAGASLTIDLYEGTVTTGTLLIPGGAEDGTDLEADLIGSWRLEDSTVTFFQAADTFVRDMAFRAERGRLVGEGTFDGVTIRIVLERL